jgi:hypothetical protein
MARTYLSTSLRKELERTVGTAREVVETGATDALRRLGVGKAEAPKYLSDADRQLRNRLRAQGRALGDRRDAASGRQETKHLLEATGYEHWHRMLFARFLIENRLLREPATGGEVSLEDCRQLSAHEGLPNEWAVAGKYASSMLPAIFRPDDPVLALELAPETFHAEDSLGWSYQFWRAEERAAVNASDSKVGADELPAVTQLFTEPYMVQFLLHNTLGAWWAGKVLAVKPDLVTSAPDEASMRAACALPDLDWEFLRFVREDGAWRPAAGTFPGWPKRSAELAVMDPCCGSGHFLTEAFAILAALRTAEEGLAAREAAVAVLRDNLFGLEIDGRCVQIAAFAVALAAWRLAGEPCALPVPHIAWVGQPLAVGRNEFTALANSDDDLRAGLAALFELFEQAPLLGSLIDPTGGDLMDPTTAGADRAFA